MLPIKTTVRIPTARILEPELEAEDNKAKVTFTYILPTTPNAQCRLSYEVDGDGRVKTTLSYDPVKELGDMPEFGVMFKLSADYDHLEWYGLGPAETYADRCKVPDWAFTGIW